MVQRLHGLDALRGIAALVVAYHHLSYLSGHGGHATIAFLAVDLFFLLSGFVMARTYEDRLRSGGLTAAGFVALRYRRLFLPMAIGTTLGMVWLIVDGSPFSARLVSAYALWLIFLPAPWFNNVFLANVPTWSLLLEMISNALHGALFARMSNRLIAVLLLTCSLLTLALLAAGFAQWGKDTISILSCLPRELSYYLAGILVFRRYGDAPFRFANGRWAVWLGALSYPLYATHVPVMGMLIASGTRPPITMVAALGFAALVAVVTQLQPLKNSRSASLTTSARA